MDGGLLCMKKLLTASSTAGSPVALCLLQFTNWSKSFKGTLDYIFHTSESLVPVATLELPDESDIARHNGLPNENWSSDHIALLAEFKYVQS